MGNRLKYLPEKYLRYVERTTEPILNNYMDDEIHFIKNILKSDNYCVFELGSGYGRIIPAINKYSDFVTAIELDDNMYNELHLKNKYVDNVICLHEDITKLKQYVKLDSNKKNVFLLCQNTLGVIEGDYNEMLENIREMSKDYHIEIIFSIFNKNALKSYGLELYKEIKKMVGDFDSSKSDLESGIFVSNTGYLSKWWSKNEMDQIIKSLNGSILSQKIDQIYSIYHVKI